MDKHTEAYETVRKALRHDVNSALCWDVMSHLQLEKKNFREAAKCVSNALVHQPVSFLFSVFAFVDKVAACLHLRRTTFILSVS